jgi:hypothetical protein
VLGPALIPLSAAAIPALTGALAGMGAAAGAVGVTLLAFNGIGDALKAIDKAQLQPTVENLQAMQVALEKLGPAGAEFARFLDGLEPQLHDLQNVARAGLFPGVEDGINELLSRLPLVRQVVADLSSGLGDLARDAGRSLSSDAWTPFFDYVANTAGPTMDDFARATGNVALGFANLLVAFAPMTSGFTSGLVDATRAFADWSSTLDSNKSFQSFLDTVRQSGPQALDLFTALAKALVGLVKAAAPFGQVVLPALTATANLFATIANSPIGPGLYAAAAGMVAFNRAADLAGRSSARFQASWDKLGKAQVGAGVAGGLGLLALSLTDVDNKLGVANTAMGTMAGLMVGGPWGAAIGAGIGATLDFRDSPVGAQRRDGTHVRGDRAAMGRWSRSGTEYARLSDEIDHAGNTSVGSGWLFGTRSRSLRAVRSSTGRSRTRAVWPTCSRATIGHGEAVEGCGGGGK